MPGISHAFYNLLAWAAQPLLRRKLARRAVAEPGSPGRLRLLEPAVAQAGAPAPWFEVGARWSARRALLHIIAETAQHAGHADMLREAIDGSKTMG